MDSELRATMRATATPTKINEFKRRFMRSTHMPARQAKRLALKTAALAEDIAATHAIRPGVAFVNRK